MTKKLEGVVIAMPTPLTKEEDIDVKSLRRLIDHCIGKGVNGIMIMGTMGEGASLVDLQRQVMLETTVSYVDGRVPVLATAAGASTRKTIEYAKAACMAGADYIVCLSPFYYKFPDPRSIMIHIEKISDNVKKPLIFYNAAGQTGNNIDADTTEKILNMEKVAGIKDSSCVYSNFMEILRRYPDREKRPGTIMQGDESLFDSSLLMGADGIISGGGVCFIDLLTALYKAASDGNKIKAMELQMEFTRQLLGILLPDSQRNWMFNIKKKLVDMNIISNAYCTAPFMTN